MSNDKARKLVVVVMGLALFGILVMTVNLLREDYCEDEDAQADQDSKERMARLLRELQMSSERETNLLRQLYERQRNEAGLTFQLNVANDQLGALQTPNAYPPIPAPAIAQPQSPSPPPPPQRPPPRTPPPPPPQVIPPQPSDPNYVPPPPAPVVSAIQQAENIVAQPQSNNNIGILLFCFARPKELGKTIESLLKYAPGGGQFPIYVSQDGNNGQVTALLQNYAAQGKIVHLQHPPEVQRRDIKKGEEQWETYYKIAAHYRFGLGNMFDTYQFRKVIIMEDDMEIAPDFYSYFSAMARLLDEDPTLLCASAWNDNGQHQFVSDPQQLYRTECFPGLGWMMRKELWEELKPKWPRGFWDDWLREPDQRRKRSCVYPEINRVYTFGEKGASAGQFFKQYLARIRLNDQPQDFMSMDLSYLHQANYDALFESWIRSATVVSNPNQVPARVSALSSSSPTNFIVRYNNLKQLEQYLRQIRLMNDHKAGIPRGSYRGTVQYRFKGHRVMLVPASPTAIQYD